MFYRIDSLLIIFNIYIHVYSISNPTTSSNSHSVNVYISKKDAFRFINIQNIDK